MLQLHVLRGNRYTGAGAPIGVAGYALPAVQSGSFVRAVSCVISENVKARIETAKLVNFTYGQFGGFSLSVSHVLLICVYRQGFLAHSAVVLEEIVERL